MKTGIIIPCYNEAKRLDQKTFLTFISENADYHLCFVNDGSKDDTMGVLTNMKAYAPNDITVIDIKKNMGKATAVRAGARYLFNKPQIANVGFMDADLSTDFKDFKDLVKTLKSNKELSVVFGSRNTGGVGIKRDLFRGIFSNVIKAFILFILGLPIRDTQCGAKVFARSIIPVIYGEKFTSRWLFDLEIFLRLKAYFGKKNVMGIIQEQPLMRWIHVEDSKLGLKDSVVIPMRLFLIWMRYNVATSFKLTSVSTEIPTLSLINNKELTIAA